MTLGLVELSQVVHPGESVLVFLAEEPFAQLQGLGEKRFGFLELTLIAVETAQEAHRDEGVEVLRELRPEIPYPLTNSGIALIEPISPSLSAATRRNGQVGEAFTFAGHRSDHLGSSSKLYLLLVARGRLRLQEFP